MTDPPLFDVTALYVPPPASADPALSPDRRRTLRQRETIRAGRHPLTNGPLHPDADPDTSPDAPRGLPFTCGSCRFREQIRHHHRTYPKCLRDLTYGGHDAGSVTLDDIRHVSRGAATDVRGWWPGCDGYEPGDRGVSPDAARSIAQPDERTN